MENSVAASNIVQVTRFRSYSAAVADGVVNLTIMYERPVCLDMCPVDPMYLPCSLCVFRLDVPKGTSAFPCWLWPPEMQLSLDQRRCTEGFPKLGVRTINGESNGKENGE